MVQFMTEPCLIFSDDSNEVKDGGAAMKAYQDLIFTNDDKKKLQISKQLRTYCELDTMAMVIIFTHWQQLATGK